MKSIQASIRANETKIDESLQSKKDSVYTLLLPSNPKDIQNILQVLLQTLRNKSNIIFTIHRNELAALNSKKESNPIGSRLYLAILLIRKLFEGDHDALGSIISELLQMIMDAWISNLQQTFTQLKELNNDFFALSWLSNHFTGLSVRYEDAEIVLASLGFCVQELKTKYSNQAALLSGLFESERVALKSSEVDEPKSTNLLTHFISL